MKFSIRHIAIVGLLTFCTINSAAAQDFIVGGFDPASGVNTTTSGMTPQQMVIVMKDLFRDPQDPVGGNPQGVVSLVEFFDYQCSHCESMAPIVADIIKNNPNLRVVYKEFPIRGSLSNFAARACVAANKQGKFMALHEAIMTMGDTMSEDNIMTTASKLGLNVSQLKTDMDSAAVKAVLDSVYNLARKMQITATPAFFVAKTHGDNMQFINGEVSQATLEDAIKKMQG